MDIAAFKAQLKGSVVEKKQAILTPSEQRMQDTYNATQSILSGIATSEYRMPDESFKGRAAAPTNTPDDTYLTRKAKDIFNAVAPDSMQVGVNFGGRQHFNTSQKDFNNLSQQEVSKRIQDTPDDPNAAGTFYYLKVKDGWDDKGNQKYLYKAGISGDSVFQRYMGELRPDQYEIVHEKRTNAYKDLEAMTHGSRANIANRAFEDTGLHKTSGRLMPSGNSELYTKDILGLDKPGTNYGANRDKAMSNFLAHQDDSHNSGLSNYASAVGSGALNLVGKASKLIGEADPTTSFGTKDNNIMTRFGEHLIQNADKIADYNNHDEVMAIHGLQKGIKSGDPLAVVDAFITGGPELFLKSLPEMATLVGTGGAGALMLGANVAMNANDQMDNRMKANGGKNLTATEKLGVTALQAISTMTDSGAARFGLNMNVMGKPILSMISAKTGKAMSVEAILAKAEPTVARAILKAASTSIMKSGSVVAAEGGQEALQESIAVLQEQYGIDKNAGKGVTDLLAANKQRIMDAGAGGALAGGVTGGYHGVTSGASELASGIGEVNRNTQLRNQSVSGSTGDAELNSLRQGTIRDDLIQQHGNLTSVHEGIQQAAANSNSAAEALDNIQQAVGNNTHTQSMVAEQKAALVSGVLSSMSPVSLGNLNTALSSDPELQQLHMSNLEQITQNPAAAKLSPEQVQQVAINQTLNAISASQANNVLNSVDPTTTQSIYGKADIGSITAAISGSIEAQLNETGVGISEADRQAKFYTESAPSIKSSTDAVANLSQKSARWARKATKNVTDTLSKMSDEALVEAAANPDDLSKASKKTRTILQTLMGKENESGKVSPAEMAKLIAAEQKTRAGKVTANEIAVHSTGQSKQAGKEIKVIHDALKVAIATKGTDTVGAKGIYKTDASIKDLYTYTKEFIERGVDTVEDREAINKIIDEIETNVGIMRPAMVKKLRDKLDSAGKRTEPSSLKPHQTSIPKNLTDAEAKSKRLVKGVLDKGNLKTKEALAGKLREAYYGSLRDVGIMREAIAAAIKSGEVNQSLGNSMNKKLDSIEVTTKASITANKTPEQSDEEVEASQAAAPAVLSTLELVREYAPEATVKDIGSIFTVPTEEALDKIVKIICG